MLGGTKLRPMVLNTYGNFTGHMVAPLQLNVDRYEESYRTCLRTGDHWWGAWAAHWARVHCGVMMLGTIGETERMDSTVISDAVNIASRLEGLTKEARVGIIISQDVLSKLEDQSRFNTRSLGTSTVKGRTEPIGIHALEG